MRTTLARLFTGGVLAAATAACGGGDAPQSGPDSPAAEVREARAEHTGFPSPTGLAFGPDGAMYVSNWSAGTVERIGPDGERSTRVDALDAPSGLAVDEAGVEFAFGDVYPRPGLDLPRRQLVTLGGLIALGDTAPQQRVHINAALNVGLSSRQVVETVIQVFPYAGFPRALNAVGPVREVFDAHGIGD